MKCDFLGNLFTFRNLGDDEKMKWFHLTKFLKHLFTTCDDFNCIIKMNDIVLELTFYSFFLIRFITKVNHHVMLHFVYKVTK